MNKFQIYLSSSWHNRENARQAMNLLEDAGHVITHDWTAQPQTKDLRILRDHSVADFDGVRRCQVYVMLWPGRLGSAAEMGIALGLNKRLFIVGGVDRTDFVFANYPTVRIFPMITDLIRHLQEIRP